MIKSLEDLHKKNNKNTKYVLNEEIENRYDQVVLIDEGDKNCGTVDVARALSIAYSKGLDLLLVGQGEVPTCKVVDFEKYAYAEKKKKAPKQQGMSSVRFGLATDVNDYNVKLKKAMKFLEKGDKVSIVLRCKGKREFVHIEEGGMGVVKKVISDLNDVARIEQPPKINGRSVRAVLSPMPKKK